MSQASISEPLTWQEIDQMEMAVLMIWGDNPMPGFDRLIYTARIGAKFLEATEERKKS